MKYIVVVHALPEGVKGADCPEAVFVGQISLLASNPQEARGRAIDALWDDRLTAASCRARARIIGRSADEEPAAVCAARSTLSHLQQSIRFRKGELSELEWRWYCFWWTWTAVRFSSSRQDRARAKLDSERFYRRLERVKAWRARPLEGGLHHAA